jgi:3-oxoacyl-[acyl-carrier-protein] synthase III
MKIANIDCIIPSCKIENQDIIDLVSSHSKNIFEGDMSELKLTINSLLEKTGIKSRFWRNKSERPLNLIQQSFVNLMDSINFNKNEIDTLIYTGIDRGFIEPANACFIAKKIGLEKVRTFDIVDACMGWCTALQVAQGLINNNDSKVVLIVSSEFPMDYGGIIMPRNFTVKNLNELSWKFPSYTIGEGITTTLVINSPDKWEFWFDSDSKKVDLCTIPLYKFKEYSDSTSRLNEKEQFYFSAYGRELYVSGYRKAHRILATAITNSQKDIKLIIPHSVSLSVPQSVGKSLGVQERIYSSFPKIGNISTASVPASIYYSLLSGRTKKGDCLLGWIASAGLKYSAFEIVL